MTPDEIRQLRDYAASVEDHGGHPVSSQRVVMAIDAMQAEIETLRGEAAVMSLSRMLGLGEPVRPDIHRRLLAERDALRAEIEDWKQRTLISNEHEDAMGAELERMRPVFEAAVKWLCHDGPIGAIIDAIDAASPREQGGK
jgi:hypothetical protein